ncbi:hypothetical protein BDZ89DRAFT_1146121 [Hymenopellis radicata]|nr:hypothetical protein BDZ89DRAFT_1146121 [Hymenopellis radicata]
MTGDASASAAPSDFYDVHEDEEDDDDNDVPSDEEQGHGDQSDEMEDVDEERAVDEDDVDVDDDEDAGVVFREWLEQAQANEVFETLDASDSPALGQAGPGPSTQRVRINALLGGRARYLDDEDDTKSERVSVPHPTAGAVIRMSQTVHEQWAA